MQTLQGGYNFVQETKVLNINNNIYLKKLKSYLYKIIIKNIIKYDLTIFRIENDLVPFTQEQINNFILINKQSICDSIEEIINVYNDDDELELLEHPETDWLREFLYDKIELPI